MIRKAFFGLLFFLSLASRADEVLQANQLLSFFSAGCNQGEWTKSALSQAQNLILVLESVRDDPDCQTLAGAVGQIDFLGRKITQLTTNYSQFEIESLRQQEKELLLQLSFAQSATERDLISSQLSSVKVQLAAQEGYLRAGEKYAPNENTYALQNLLSGVDQLLVTVQNNQRCLIRHPSILSGVASLAGAVGSAVASPLAGLGLAAGVQLFGSILEHVRVNRIQRQIHNVARSMVNEAMQCVSESLSNQWCAAQDALNVLDVKSRALLEGYPKGGVWVGLKLLERDLPTIVKWLETVEGNPAATGSKAIGERQSDVLSRESHVERVVYPVAGILRDKQRQFNAIPDTGNPTEDARKRYEIVEDTILEILDKLGVTFQAGYPIPRFQGFTHPLFDIYSMFNSPYILLGLAEEQIPIVPASGFPISFEQFNPFSQWPVKGATYTPSLDIIRKSFDAWVAAAKEKIEIEKSIVLQPDSLQVFNEAVEINKWGIRPKDSVENFILFLREQKPETFLTQSLAQIYDDSIQRLEDFLKIIQDVTELKITPEKGIQEIFKIAKLEFGTSFISGRLRGRVRENLNRILLDRDDPENRELVAQLLVSEDLLGDFSRLRAGTSHKEIELDLLGAQRVTENSYQQFAEIFAENLVTTLRYYRDREERYDGPRRKYFTARSSLCAKLMGVPHLPEEISKNLCEGTMLSSFENGPRTQEITLEDFKLPIEERACRYRNFLRRSRIFQEYLENRPGVAYIYSFDPGHPLYAVDELLENYNSESRKRTPDWEKMKVAMIGVAIRVRSIPEGDARRRRIARILFSSWKEDGIRERVRGLNQTRPGWYQRTLAEQLKNEHPEIQTLVAEEYELEKLRDPNTIPDPWFEKNWWAQRDKMVDDWKEHLDWYQGLLQSNQL